MFATFDELSVAATGFAPYGYQREVADQGLPDLLAVPTGAGKTAAVVLAWLWRRRFHPNPAVRAATPRWLVICEPLRTLTDQTERVVTGWLSRLGVEDAVGVNVLMGGGVPREKDWRLDPGRDAVFVGTLDMLLSRALNRGYGESRFAYPIDFGLFNSGVAWVFDEVQLMGPALETSRQLDGLRRKLGVGLRCTSTWMSATVPRSRMETVDNPQVGSVITLGVEDKKGPLSRRLEATKKVRELRLESKDDKARARQLADELVSAHRSGGLTVAVHNTVKSAQATFDALRKLSTECELVLLHSRYRPGDRREREELAIHALVDPHGPGRLVVVTQVLEAGVDISADVLFTEAAPWPSIIQRAGRCNRDGQVDAAEFLWAEPPKPGPYLQPDIDAAVAALRDMEGSSATPGLLSERDVLVTEESYAVLRRRDLIGLFDTSPDLSGNDIDVAPFIREVQELDVNVVWRGWPEAGPADDEPRPSSEELCSAPVYEVRDLIKKGRRAWTLDHFEGSSSAWKRLSAEDVRPGLTVVFRASEGGYARDVGWQPTLKAAVPLLTVTPEGPSLIELEERVGDDGLSMIGPKNRSWYPLLDHLADVEREVRLLAAGLGITDADTPDELIEAAAIAGRLHDIGKAHSVFQDTLARTAPPEPPSHGDPWAKSGGDVMARHSRHNFRHELASALALFDAGSIVLEGCSEPDLVRYLVAAHHGRVRLSMRSVQGDDMTALAEGRDVILGVAEKDVLPQVEIPGGYVPESILSLGVARLGMRDGVQASWTDIATGLRDRADIGPFRLAFLEALVRLADWRASAEAAGIIPARKA